MSSSSGRDWLNTEALAKYLGTTANGIRLRLHRGLLPKPRKPHGPRGKSYWKPEDVDQQYESASNQAETPRPSLKSPDPLERELAQWLAKLIRKGDSPMLRTLKRERPHWFRGQVSKPGVRK